jgi:hypothetical protein
MRQPLCLLAGLVLLTAGVTQAAPVAATQPRARATTARPPRLVVTQRPRGTSGATSASSVDAALLGPAEGARLVLVESGRVVKVLSTGFASAADPEVSYDGRRLLFAGQRQAGERWAIFEMNVDGTGLRLVASGPDDLREPLYLPTVYTLIADPAKGTEPREQIGYVRVSSTLRNEGGDAPQTSLYSIQTDGSGARRLTFSLGNELDPTVLPDGRVLYASWQRASERHGAEGRVTLVGLNADGTDTALFSADEGRRVKRMPCLTRKGLVVFVEGERPLTEGAGTLACVTMRRNLHSYRPITSEKDGLFRSPSPLADGQIVAAHRAADARGTFGLVVVDPVSGQTRPVFDDPTYDEIQVREAAPRPATDERSSAIKDPDVELRGTKEAKASYGPTADFPDAKLYGVNVYLNDLGADLAPGTIAGLRIIEGLDAAAGAKVQPGAPAPRRLVGVAPVEADDSYHVLVPAEKPLQLQLLDQDGLALSSSGWIWAQYKGQQGCVGCHEDGELTPPNRFVDAIARPATNLLLAPEKRRSVDYQHDIGPLVLSRCAECHAAGGAVDLSGPGAFATLGRYLDPGRARTSRLIWHLLGRNTARPWDGARATAPVKPLPMGVELTDDERRLFIEWVDLGALFDVTSSVTGGK